jgi:hypothetical protein
MLVRVALMLAAFATVAPAAFAQAPRYPFPQHVVHAAGTISPSQRTQAQLDADVRAAYARWKANHLLAAGTEADGQPRYRVRHSAGAQPDTVSEGQGYGMVVVAILAGHDPAARTIFDGLWHFFDDHRSSIDDRLMDWNVPADESDNPPEEDSAFDGDADIAFALLLADRQWGSDLRIDYKRQALDVLAGLESSALGPQSRLPMLGDWVDPNGSSYNQRTVRTSDFMPGHFRAFAAETGHAAWSQAVVAVLASASSLQTNWSPVTGLLPDFTVPTSAVDTTPRPAPPGFLEGAHDGAYFYNAGRDPWRFATDALLSGDATSKAIAATITNWARSEAGGDPQELDAGFTLAGAPLPGSAYFSTFFVAPMGVAAMLVPARQAWLDAIWEAVRVEEQGYYEDSVTLLSMLVMSRNFWRPDRPDWIFVDGFASGNTGDWSATSP